MKVSTSILRTILSDGATLEMAQELGEGDVRDFLAWLEKQRLLLVGPDADVQLGSKLT